MSIRTYNPSVRVGNWNEDICLEEDLLKDFLEKRERGELLIQRAHKLLETILQKTELSVSRDGFVHIGDKVMLINPGQEKVPPSLQQIEPPRPPTSLALNMDEYTLLMEDKIDIPCSVSCTPMLKPCVRNTFVITSVDGSAMESVLRFGQPFAISTLEGYASNLKLFSDHQRFNLSAKKSREQLVQLVEETNYLTTWQVVPFHPQHRLEMQGLPVPANSKVLIQHNKTGQNLNISDKFRIRTMFGREYEVSGRINLDSHKAEVDTNHWVIVSGNPSDDETTQFDRPIPEPSIVARKEKSADIPLATPETEQTAGEDKPVTA